MIPAQRAPRKAPQPLPVDELTPLEVASGLLIGLQPGADVLPEPPAAPARVAFEQVLLRALQAPPCVISFSGGRDSSAVLGVAAAVARRAGLPDPIPVSLRFPQAPETDESAWQELVVRHLGIATWERPTFTDELDLVGPYAVAVLRRLGLRYPFNLHFLSPMIEQAAGGTFLTGFGGDELLLPSDWLRVNQVLTRSARARPSDVARLALAFGPTRPRARYFLRRGRLDLAWLRPAADREFARRRAAALAAQPTGWDGWIRHAWWPSRLRAVTTASIADLAAGSDVVAVHPLLDPRFLAALARDHGRLGFRRRTEAMTYLFGDLLPPAILSRGTKAAFDAVFVTDRYARPLIASWDGRGLHPDLVDPDALQASWRSPRTDARSYVLVQALWLQHQRAASSQRAQEQPRGRRE